MTNSENLSWLCFAFTSHLQEVRWDPRVTLNKSSGSPLAFNMSSVRLVDRLASNAFLLFRTPTGHYGPQWWSVECELSQGLKA